MGSKAHQYQTKSSESTSKLLSMLGFLGKILASHTFLPSQRAAVGKELQQKVTLFISHCMW